MIAGEDDKYTIFQSRFACLKYCEEEISRRTDGMNGRFEMKLCGQREGRQQEDHGESLEYYFSG
jgi:hypothetical protein